MSRPQYLTIPGVPSKPDERGWSLHNKKEAAGIARQLDATSIPSRSHSPYPSSISTSTTFLPGASASSLALTMPSSATTTIGPGAWSYISKGSNYSGTPIQRTPSGTTNVSIPSSLPRDLRRRRRRRFALLVSITYEDTPAKYLEIWPKLHNSYKDTNNLKSLLIDDYGWDENEIVILCDKDQPPETWPTKKNIQFQLDWLVKEAKKGDLVFVSFSCHGYQRPAADVKSETDGKDEYLVPCDWWQSSLDADIASSGELGGQVIYDNELRSRFIEKLERCNVIALVDACHSATIFDLPYESHGMEITELEDQHVKGWGMRLAERCHPALGNLIKRWSRCSQIRANVISICSCPDKDESFDSSNGGILVQAFCTKMREKAVINSRRGIKANVLIEDLRTRCQGLQIEAKRKYTETCRSWDEQWKAPYPEVGFSQPRYDPWSARVSLDLVSHHRLL